MVPLAPVSTARKGSRSHLVATIEQPCPLNKKAWFSCFDVVYLPQQFLYFFPLPHGKEVAPTWSRQLNNHALYKTSHDLNASIVIIYRSNSYISYHCRTGLVHFDRFFCLRELRWLVLWHRCCRARFRSLS